MKLVYAVSQRTKAKRLSARHIDNGREPFFWASEEGEPTCKICMDLAMMLRDEQDNSKSLDLEK